MRPAQRNWEMAAAGERRYMPKRKDKVVRHVEQRGEYRAMLALARLGLGNSTPDEALAEVAPGTEWGEVARIALDHRLTAVTWDGIVALENGGGLTGERAIPQDIRDRWLVRTAQYFELEFERYEDALFHLARFYNKNGIRMMVLKGYGLALSYPVPAHRPTGDIDIWLFGEQQRGDDLLREQKNKHIDTSRHHHTGFNIGKYPVENHYDFLNIHSHRINRKIDLKLKELAPIAPLRIEIQGAEAYLPSADFNSIFLLHHTAKHFASAEIHMRHLADWGTFIRRRGSEVDWARMLPLIKEFSLCPLLACFNEICIRHLGFERSLFPTLEVDEELLQRITDDILEPEFSEAEPDGGPIARYTYRIKRWRAHGWKQRLVFPDSPLREFFTLAASHLRTPEADRRP